MGATLNYDLERLATALAQYVGEPVRWDTLGATVVLTMDQANRLLDLLEATLDAEAPGVFDRNQVRMIREVGDVDYGPFHAVIVSHPLDPSATNQAAQAERLAGEVAAYYEANYQDDWQAFAFIVVGNDVVVTLYTRWGGRHLSSPIVALVP